MDARESSAPRIQSLLLGTSNRGKVAELVELFAPVGLSLVSLADLGAPPEVAETGQTLAENAALKATAYARCYRCWTLADDTSLSVDALGGAPGLFTARYAGPKATAADNRQRLLTELAGVPLTNRTAHFTCHLALADPEGVIRATSEGRCHGRIRLEPEGTGGFGYDPLFELMEYRLTFAELGGAGKTLLSHRARAAEQMAKRLAEMSSSPGC
jgi:XTP/dITP diphosphohydrolase